MRHQEYTAGNIVSQPMLFYLPLSHKKTSSETGDKQPIIIKKKKNIVIISGIIMLENFVHVNRKRNKILWIYNVET